MNKTFVRISYRKLSFNDVKRHIDKYYKLNWTQKYSSSLDILASYLKGQKIIYMEACNYTLNRLYILMIPAMFITAFVLSLNLYGNVILSVNMFYLVLMDF